MMNLVNKLVKPGVDAIVRQAIEAKVGGRSYTITNVADYGGKWNVELTIAGYGLCRAEISIKNPQNTHISKMVSRDADRLLARVAKQQEKPKAQKMPGHAPIIGW